MNTDTVIRSCTEQVEQPLRFDAWTESLQDVYGTWQVGATPDGDFRGSIQRRSIGGLQVVDCACDPHSAHRLHKSVLADAAEQLTLQLVVEGREAFTVDDNTVMLGPGDVLVWTSLLPMSFEVLQRLRKISVTMPLARVRSWFPDSWDRLENRLPGTAPGVDLLGSFLSAMSGSVLSDGAADGEALTESVLGVLRNVVRPDTASPTAGLVEAQRAKVRNHIDRHLDDPTLSPLTVAAANHISVRYLHQLFEGTGETVLGHIMTERLRRCSTDLQNPAMIDRTITDIAFSWGFQDSAHFSRRFRAEFSQSPREYRANSTRHQLARLA